MGQHDPGQAAALLDLGGQRLEVLVERRPGVDQPCGPTADDRIADLLAARNIVWAPDFVVNAGGIINIVEELDEYSPANARRRVRHIADTLREIFDHAEKLSVTPLAAANELARERLLG